MYRNIAAFLLLLCTTALSAHDSDQLEKLETELEQLSQRLSELEAIVGDSSTDSLPAYRGNGWESLANWRKLDTDMGPEDVREILGEPSQLDGGDIAEWRYANGGEVTFMRGRVWKWIEPRY